LPSRPSRSGSTTRACGNSLNSAEFAAREHLGLCISFHRPEATPFGMGRMLFAGSPETVVERLRAFQSITGVGMVDLVVSSAQIPDEDVRRSIELFGRDVLPRIHAFAKSAEKAQ
jgi:hypothetical protein